MRAPPTTDPDAIADRAVLQRIARGDTRALALLYERYESLLVAVGTSILRDPHEARDIAHDVFLEAWRAASTYDASRGSVRTWLLLRMRSRALDRHRMCATALAARARIRQMSPASARERPDTLHDEARVRDAVQALPERHRQVIVLHYYRGLSCSQMAARLELPLGTIKSRSLAAVRALGAHLRV